MHGTELGSALREFVHEFADKRVSCGPESIGRKTTQMNGRDDRLPDAGPVHCALQPGGGDARANPDERKLRMRRPPPPRPGSPASRALGLLQPVRRRHGAAARSVSGRSDAAGGRPQCRQFRDLYLGIVDKLRQGGKSRAALAYLDDYDNRNPGDVRARSCARIPSSTYRTTTGRKGSTGN